MSSFRSSTLPPFKGVEEERLLLTVGGEVVDSVVDVGDSAVVVEAVVEMVTYFFLQIVVEA